jgi:HD-GYP domain-containing protein (c-di-GMP phosphodiesterase class II)
VSDDLANARNLIAVSITLLFDGMEVQEDVYDYNAERLIIRKGTTLKDGDIAITKNVNEGMDTIYVSGRTYETLLERSPKVETESLSKMEESTGYSAATDVTFELLDDIANDKVPSQEALMSVSADLSNRLEVTSPSTILSLINAMAPVDEYLQRHCIDVSLLNGLIGKWLGLPRKDVDRLVLIGLLHDCGKARIPPQVLNAPRKLTVVEFEVIKMHTVYTYQLLTEFPEDVRRAARCHHEKVSGKGYPDALPRASMPIEACITAISDIYDAMVAQRAYKKPRSPFSVMALLQELAGTELDAGLVKVFIQNMPKELMNKPVLMSDGEIGIVRSYDPNDIEYPMVEIHGRIQKTNEQWHCMSMYIEE